jgi:phage terminase small subunit
MTKNLTNAEKQARLDAEAATLPQREKLSIEPPAYVARGDRQALKYWEQVLARIESAGVELLDDLDTETLGLYCSMLSRHDKTDKSVKQLRKLVKQAETVEEKLSILDKIDGVERKLQSQERLILQYADRLGLTPASRAGLAKKKAAEAVDDPDADLFD